MRSFQDNVHQERVLTKSYKPQLWYRSVSAGDLRITSPLDDERGTMEEATNLGDISRVKYLQTCLLVAVANMPEGAVRKLLRFKADVNARSKEGRTPLHQAVSLSRMAIVRDLVASNADINEYDTEGRSALHWAAEGNLVEACAFLISHKADVNARTHQRQWTPLLYSCKGLVQDLPAAILLVLNKADINAKTTKGRKPLELVREPAHRQALEDAGAVVNADASLMARGCSTQYACAFWHSLLRASRFFDSGLVATFFSTRVFDSWTGEGGGEGEGGAITGTTNAGQRCRRHPVVTPEDMTVTRVVRDLVRSGADPELLLLSVVDIACQLDEAFMLRCIDVLQGEHGAKGLVAPSESNVGAHDVCMLCV